MKSFLKNLATGIAVFGIILGLALVFVSGAFADDSGPPPELTAEWWQWLLSVPGNNLLLDTTGEYCRVKQVGSAFFLVGSWAGEVTRKCKVPDDTPILIPLINWECSNVEDPEGGFYGATPDERQACAQNIMQWIDPGSLVATLNEEPLPFYGILSPDFPFRMPPGNNHFGLKGVRSGYASSGGYWSYLESLEPGSYELHVEAACKVGSPCYGFTQNVTYKLTVR